MNKTIVEIKELKYQDGDDFKKFVNKFLELEKELNYYLK